MIRQMLKSTTGYSFTPEYRFHEFRKWRFDYANFDLKVAVEIEGGAYTNGRHTRGKGFIGDMEKYNAAIELGWVVLRYTPDQMERIDAYNQIKIVCDGRARETNKI